MSFVRVELSCFELSVVLFDVAHLSIFEQLVTVIHLYTEGVERVYHFFVIGDNRLFTIR